MGTSIFKRLRTSCLLVLGVALAVFLVDPTPASAWPGYPGIWFDEYGPLPADASCELCHAPDPLGGGGRDSWNGYGNDIRLVLGEPGCVEPVEAFRCVELMNSDGDPGAFSNIDEIFAIPEATQPGWTEGPNNTIFTRSAEFPFQDPFAGLEPYDPEGAGGTGGTGGMGGMGGEGGMGGTGGDECNGNHDPIPPGQIKRSSIVVKPGQSIQEALDMAQEGTRIYVHAGIYEEPCNLTNGLNITKSGIHLVGQSKSNSDNEKKRVIIQRTGNQRNGIVIVPPEVPAAAQPVGSAEVERTDCMGCHTDMGPPFPLHPNVPVVIPLDTDPYLYDITIENITVRNFKNNGFFTEHVDGFVFDNIRSIDNENYGIFPVLSKNGVIKNSFSTGSFKDSALWVETSVNVLVQGNVVTDSTNGIEVSNSDDILVIDNEAYNNAIGAAILLLPDIYDNHDSAKRIDLVNNWFHDNNRENGANPGSILSFIPRGQGILYVGADDGEISGNLVEDNDFIGIAIVDYCLPFMGTPFDCSLDPDITPEFLADQAAENNSVVDNNLFNNGMYPDPGPFQPFAADLTLLTIGDHNNCFQNNIFSTEFSTIGVLPPCAP